MVNRSRRPRKGMNNKGQVCSLSASTIEPLASSSPERCHMDDMDDEDFEELVRQHLKKYVIESNEKFEKFLEGFNPEAQDKSFSEFLAFMDKGGPKDKELKTTSKQQNLADLNDSEFKYPPKSVPKNRKRVAGNPNCAPGTSKVVHWDSALHSTTDSEDKNKSDSDVFKTPPRKGTNVNKDTSTASKTPYTLRKNPFAVVINNEVMNKNVQVLRMPQAGETAVSLSGSPLLVTPFGATNSSQAALIVGSNNGKVMTILNPDQTSPTSDPEMFSHLESETKKKIKHFARYLLKKMNSC